MDQCGGDVLSTRTTLPLSSFSCRALASSTLPE